MKFALPLKEMTLAEKIGVMEELWKDLSRPGAEYSPPGWHGLVLAERMRLAQSGEIGFTPVFIGCCQGAFRTRFIILSTGNLFLFLR